LELWPIPVDVVEDLDERVLGQILGQLAIANHAVDQREHRPLVPSNQLAKGRIAALLRKRDDVGVRKVEKIEGWRWRRRHQALKAREQWCPAPRVGPSQSTWAPFGKPAASA